MPKFFFSRSLICPKLDFTTNPFPRNFSRVLAFAGDSTITKFSILIPPKQHNIHELLPDCIKNLCKSKVFIKILNCRIKSHYTLTNRNLYMLDIFHRLMLHRTWGSLWCAYPDSLHEPPQYDPQVHEQSHPG